MNYWILPLTFQIVLQSIVVFPFTLIFGRPRRFKQGILCIEWWPFFDRVWDFTTCIWYLFGSSPWKDEDPATWFHEVAVHVDQYENMAIVADIVAAAVLLWGHLSGVETWPLALGIWASGGPLWLAPGFLTSARHRKAWKELGWKTWYGLYRFAWFERSAWAQTREFVRNGGGR